MQIENRKHKTLRRFNKQLKEIAEIQGVEQNVTSYVIRHSFATNLKFAGVSTDLIGQSMGHHDVSVTQAYLKEFNDDIIDDAMSKLLEESILKYAS
ncbi:phage integrase family protein [Mariniflexile fucanivorans]|uniref:Phage integrase family protein n=2 Tax=Mariniflexile fucanivorans TaxID=264023 RepID=A0A4R1R8H8_9FLAO|nr:phage integrase family protein [Mariniflexile fucanivorans]